MPRLCRAVRSDGSDQPNPSFLGINPPARKVAEQHPSSPAPSEVTGETPFTPGSAESAANVIPYRIFSTFRRNGRIWKDVLITGHPTGQELVAVAKALHQQFPAVRFALYNDKTEIANCNWNSIHYDKPSRGCGDEWRSKHYYGIVNQMGSTSGLRWEYVLGNASLPDLLQDVPLE